MSYNVGDKVRVRSDLEGNQDYCGLYCCNEMAGFKGQIVTIAEINGNRYKIKEDDKFYWWSDDLFEDTTIGNTIDKLINNPERICKALSEKIQKLEGKIEGLEYDKYDLKIKNNYLKGKVEAYEKILAKN